MFQEDGWTAVGEGGEKSGCYIIEKEPLDVRCYMTGNSALADNEFIQVSEKTIGQYTGLKDKNGKKIFENDVVKVTDSADELLGCGSDTGIGRVEFYDGFWYVDGGPHNSLYALNNYGYIEVIGNIHDNPELVEADS